MKIEIIPNEQTPRVKTIYGPAKSHLDLIKGYIKNVRPQLDAFLEFAKTQENAVGLAANQVSIDGERFMVRAFAIRSLVTDEWSLVIDPEIEGIGIKELKAEGCLTWKGKKIIAERYRAVRVWFYDLEGQLRTNIFSGFVGQIWQHEVNHLNGVAEQVEEQDFKDPKSVEVPRNQPCPCGSGKKYKKCCLLLKD